MTSHPSSWHTFRMTSLWPMPFLPLKASVRTLNVPTTSSPALDLAFASTRSFRAALRFLRCFLLFFRAAHFLCTVLRFSHTLVCFLRSILLCPSRFLPRFQRAGGSSPNSPRRLSPTSYGHRLGSFLTWVLASLLCSLRVPRFLRR